jgi:hypothetical protein
MGWLQALRPGLYSDGLKSGKSSMLTSKIEGGAAEASDEEADIQVQNDYGAGAHPPSFYEDDMQKWHSRKFDGAIKARKNHKAFTSQRYGVDYKVGTSNCNVSKLGKVSPIKRTASRGSLPQFTSVDFEISGNSSAVNGLIKHATRGKGASASALNFDLNLRSYKNLSKFKAETPFMYPCPNNPDPVAWDKSTFKDNTNGRNYNSKTQDGNQEDAGTEDILGNKLRSEMKGRFISADPGTKFSN